MSLFTTAGTKFFIGAVKAPDAEDFDASDFTSQTWIEIGHLETMGSLGDAAGEVTFNDIGKARVQKLKGSRNAGNMEVVTGIDYADAGQVALLAAEKTPYDYAFKIEFPDKPATGGSPKNSLRYFVGKVMSVSEALDAADSVMKLNTSIAVNSNIVRVNASAT